VLVVDEDDTFGSNFLVNALSQDDSAAPIRAESVTASEGRRRIDAGEASGLLIIPEGFGRAILEESPTTLRLLVNPAQTILPKLVEETLSMLTDAVFYLHRLFGNELQLVANGPPEGMNTLEDFVVAAMAVNINQRVEKLIEQLDPTAVKLEIVEQWPDEPVAEEEEIPGGFGALFLPGIVMMSMLFMSMGQAGDIWVEREQRTLRRVVTAPGPLLGFLAGKSVAAAVLMLAVCLVGLGIGYLYLGLAPDTLPVSAVWCALAGVMLYTLMTALQVTTTSQRGGQIAAMIVIFPLMMMGGSFFPFEAMPTWMQTVGQFTPNGFALVVFKDLVRGLRGPGDLLVPFLVLVGISTGFSLYSALRMRAFARGS
jgi:ABC-type Na+ efflux pump permease subunit